MIESLQNKMIIEANKLKQKKYRSETGLFLVDGFHMVEEANRYGLLEKVFYTKEIPFVFNNAYQVSENVMKKLSALDHHQDIVGVCRVTDSKEPLGKILLLQHIQDPGNLGTLIRSALAFGFNTIVSERCVDRYNDKVLRATQGAIFKINFIECDIINFIEKYPYIPVYATDLNTDCYLEDLCLESNQFGIVLGNEGQGVSNEVVKQSRKSFKLKIDEVESLNVAIAGSIIMYHLGGK